VPDNEKKHRTHIGWSWPSTIREDQKKKPKKDEQPGPTEPHTTRSEKHWKNSKQFHIPTKNKNDSEKFSEQQLRRYMVEELLPGFSPGRRHINKTRKVKEGPLSRD
jgi:hypothetical protein